MFSSFDRIPACDRQINRQTDGQTSCIVRAVVCKNVSNFKWFPVTSKINPVGKIWYIKQSKARYILALVHRYSLGGVIIALPSSIRYFMGFRARFNDVREAAPSVPRDGFFGYES